jgi:L-threonylcarbamoyladenylate synthase
VTQVSLEALVAAARKGKIVSFPTDTVPALAVLPQQGELIFQAKRRSEEKPLILMAATAEELWPFVCGKKDEYEIWQQVAQKYWPGALTLVLPASGLVPKAMNPLDPTTIGIRVPNCAIARKILAQTGPLATTSANLSGQQSLQEVAEIEAVFPEVLVLSASEWNKQTPPQGVPSTVAKWTGKDWQILRQGRVKLVSDPAC